MGQLESILSAIEERSKQQERDYICQLVLDLNDQIEHIMGKSSYDIYSIFGPIADTFSSQTLIDFGDSNIAKLPRFCELVKCQIIKQWQSLGFEGVNKFEMDRYTYLNIVFSCIIKDTDCAKHHQLEVKNGKLLNTEKNIKQLESLIRKRWSVLDEFEIKSFSHIIDEIYITILEPPKLLELEEPVLDSLDSVSDEKFYDTIKNFKLLLELMKLQENKLPEKEFLKMMIQYLFIISRYLKVDVSLSEAYRAYLLLIREKNENNRKYQALVAQSIDIESTQLDKLVDQLNKSITQHYPFFIENLSIKGSNNIDINFKCIYKNIGIPKRKKWYNPDVFTMWEVIKNENGCFLMLSSDNQIKLKDFSNVFKKCKLQGIEPKLVNEQICLKSFTLSMPITSLENSFR